MKEDALNDVYDNNINVLIIITLLLIILSGRDKTIFFLLVIIIIGNIKRIPQTNYVNIFLRQTMYFAAFLVPYIDAKNRNFSPMKHSWVLWLAILLPALLFVLEWKSNKLFFSRKALASYQLNGKLYIILRIYNLIGAAICEELFFRAYFLYGEEAWQLIVSSIAFMGYHKSLPWGKIFGRKNILKQVIFGLISGIFFVYTNSVIPCVIFHLLYNSITIVLYIKVYIHKYLLKDISYESDEIDLDL